MEGPVGFEDIGLKKNYYALIVAVDDYSGFRENNGKDIDDLANPVRDAGNVLYLLQKNYGFHRPGKGIDLRSSKDKFKADEMPVMEFFKASDGSLFKKTLCLYNENATKENIKLFLDDLVGSDGGIKGGDKLLIYFSGHGNYDDDAGEAELFLYDETINPDLFFKRRTIREYTKDRKCLDFLLVLDCCFADTFSLENPGQPHPEEFTRKYLTSSKLEEASDGQPGKNSPFSNIIIEQLKTAKDFTCKELSSKIDRKITLKGLDQIPKYGNLPVRDVGSGLFRFKSTKRFSEKELSEFTGKLNQINYENQKGLLKPKKEKYYNIITTKGGTEKIQNYVTRTMFEKYVNRLRFHKFTNDALIIPLILGARVNGEWNLKEALEKETGVNIAGHLKEIMAEKHVVIIIDFELHTPDFIGKFNEQLKELILTLDQLWLQEQNPDIRKHHIVFMLRDMSEGHLNFDTEILSSLDEKGNIFITEELDINIDSDEIISWMEDHETELEDLDFCKGLIDRFPDLVGDLSDTPLPLIDVIERLIRKCALEDNSADITNKLFKLPDF